MRRIFIAGCVLAVMLCLSTYRSNGADAPTSQNAQSPATRPSTSFADDLVQARKQLDAVRKSKVNGIECFKQCSAIFDLCTQMVVGLKTALSAMDVVVNRSGQYGQGAQDKAIDALQRYYDRTSGLERVEISECLIERLLWKADHTPSAKAGQLVDLLQRANTVAGKIQSTMRATIHARLEAASKTKALLDRVESMKKTLKADPHDKKTREQIINFYLVTLDAPAGASAMVNEDIEPATRRRLAVAAFGGLGVEPSEVLTLGRWYRELAGKAGPEAKTNMLLRARRYYEVVLSSNSTVKRTPSTATTQPKAAPATQKTGPSMLELHAAAAAELKSIVAELEKIKTEATIKPVQHKIRGNDILFATPDSRLPKGWRRSLHGITASRASKPVVFTLSTGNIGSYDAEVQFVRSGSKGSVTVIVPVGQRQAAIVLDRGENAFCGLELIEGKAAEENETATKGKTVVNDLIQKLAVHVTVDGDKADIVATLNDEALVKWRGEGSRLSLAVMQERINSHMFGIGSEGTSDVVFLRFVVEPRPNEPAGDK